MRLFTKLQAEEIKLISYPLGIVNFRGQRLNANPDFGRDLDLRSIVGVAPGSHPVNRQPVGGPLADPAYPVGDPRNPQPVLPFVRSNTINEEAPRGSIPATAPVRTDWADYDPNNPNHLNPGYASDAPVLTRRKDETPAQYKARQGAADAEYRKAQVPADEPMPPAPVLTARADETPDQLKARQTAADDEYRKDWESKKAIVPVVVITTIHGDSHEFPAAELLFSPLVAERGDGPRVGDWYVTDYDIQTDKRICKIYDAATFKRYFKASLGG